MLSESSTILLQTDDSTLCMFFNFFKINVKNAGLPQKKYLQFSSSAQLFWP